ncbi:MAG: glycosyltransferase, partial [Acidobacteriota bacterium]
MAYFAADNGVEPIYVSELSRELSLKDAVSLFKIYREMRRQSPDIIHTHTAKAGTVGRTAAFLYRWLGWRTLIGRPRRVKIVHTFHGHVFHSYYGNAKTRVFLTIEKVLARIATDRIITISGQQLGEINVKFGVGRSDQFSVVPLGIDLSGFAQNASKRRTLRDEIGVGDNDVIVGFVGRLTGIKDISLLINAAAKVSDVADDARNLRFVIIGDGKLREELEEQVSALGVQEIVQFLGNRTDIGALLPGMDILALTSKNEGTPLSLIEGMAAGVPFVSTAVGGVVDLAGAIHEEKVGFRVCERGILTEPGSVKSFANALIFLAKNEKVRSSLSAKGSEFVALKYSKERLITDIKALYRDLAGDVAK